MCSWEIFDVGRSEVIGHGIVFDVGYDDGRHKPLWKHILDESGVLHQVVGVHKNPVTLGSDDQGESVILVEMVIRLYCLFRRG